MSLIDAMLKEPGPFVMREGKLYLKFDRVEFDSELLFVRFFNEGSHTFTMNLADTGQQPGRFITFSNIVGLCKVDVK